MAELAVMRLAARSTSRIEASIRSRTTGSRLKLLMMRRPCTVSSMVSMIRVDPSKERRANLRTRMTRRRRPSTANGMTSTEEKAISGSCRNMTATRPSNVSTSRPAVVTSTCRLSRTPLAASARRVMNSLEWRSMK